MAQFDSKGSSKPIPTIQFASICDHLGIDVESSHDQILRTFRSYYTYLKSYIEIQKNKNAAFRVESVSSIKVYLNEPSSRIWKVIPKTVITVDDSNYGWYYCPDLEDDLEEGDVINLIPGKRGLRTLDCENFRIRNHQSQFRFPEMSDLESVIIYGDELRIEPIFSQTESPVITVAGRQVEYERENEITFSVYGIIRDGNRVEIDGKNVDYRFVEKPFIPSTSVQIGDGYLVVSKNKPIEGKVIEYTNEVLESSKESEWMVDDRSLFDLGFHKIKGNIYESRSSPLDTFEYLSHSEYPGFKVKVKVNSSGSNRYRILMPESVDLDSSRDPRMIIGEDNAIIKYDGKTIFPKRFDWDDYTVEFFLKETDSKSINLGPDAEIFVRFDTKDMANQMRAIKSLRESPALDLAPLINMFILKNGQNNWPSFELKEPNNSWRVLTNPSYKGCIEQRQFVRRALSTTDFAILDGPPGTGKTTALRELIVQLILDGKRVLVASSTNAAIDNVLERLIKIDCANNSDFKSKLSAIRLGREEKASDDIKDYAMEVLLKRYSSVFEDQNLVKKLLIDSSNLVCGTIAKVYSDLIFDNYSDEDWTKSLPTVPVFDYLIMDESSKTTFQEFIVPAKLAKRWILAGDIKQLSPFTDEGAAETALDKFSEDDFKLIPARKKAIALICEGEHIRNIENKYKENARNYSIIVPDDVAEELVKEINIRNKLDGNKDAKFLFNSVNGQTVIWKSPVFNEVYSNQIVYISESSYRSFTGIVALDSYLIDLTGSFNESFHNNHYYASYESKQIDDRRRYFDKNINNFIDGLKKSWSESISWRLNRLFWLRDAIDNDKKKRYKSDIYKRIPGSLFDGHDTQKKFLRQCIYKVQNVIYNSILESLIRESDETYDALIQSFTKPQLGSRSESLIYQHRMHSDISAISSTIFYDGRIENGDYVDDTGMDYYIKGYPKMHNVWINCIGSDKNNVNQNEINVIRKQLTDFIKWAKEHPKQTDESDKRYSVIVLSFYLGQATQLKEQLKDIREDAKDYVYFKIATVDYIQGQEADIVFLSMVRQKYVGFMDTPNRLNVAITRAKHLMVFIGRQELFLGSTNELKAIAGGVQCTLN